MGVVKGFLGSIGNVGSIRRPLGDALGICSFVPGLTWRMGLFGFTTRLVKRRHPGAWRPNLRPANYTRTVWILQSR